VRLRHKHYSNPVQLLRAILGSRLREQLYAAVLRTCFGQNSVRTSLLLSVILSAVTPCASKANDNRLSVPVFYVTDRSTSQDFISRNKNQWYDKYGHKVSTAKLVKENKKPEGDFYGAGYHRLLMKKLTYSNKRNDDLSRGVDYGKVDVSVPRLVLANDTTPLSSVNSAPETEASKLSNKDNFDFLGNDFLTFWQKFAPYVEATKTKQFIVYVHGFNNSMHDGLQRAAELSASSQLPVILFSWPAKSSVFPLSYVRDAVNAAWAQGDFDSLITKLQSQSKVQSSIHLVAHSMGCRIVVNNIREQFQARIDRIYDDGCRFKSLTLLSPDVDLGVLTHEPSAYPLAAEQTRVFVSKKDNVLKLSEILNNDIRAGRFYLQSRNGSLTYDFSSEGLAPFGHGPPMNIIGKLITNQPLPADNFIQAAANGSYKISSVKSKERNLPAYDVVLQTSPSGELKIRHINLRLKWSEGVVTCTFLGCDDGLHADDDDQIGKYFKDLEFFDDTKKFHLKVNLLNEISTIRNAREFYSKNWTFPCSFEAFEQISGWKPTNFRCGYLLTDKTPPVNIGFNPVAWSPQVANSIIKPMSLDDALGLRDSFDPTSKSIIRTLVMQKNHQCDQASLKVVTSSNDQARYDRSLNELLKQNLVEYVKSNVVGLTPRGENYVNILFSSSLQWL
jgi:predicted alpha/beta hydrolase family esterase